MNVPQTFVYDFSACACKQLYLVAVIVKYFFQKCVKLLYELIIAICYGDLLMWIGNQVRPYEDNRGDTDALIGRWIDRIMKRGFSISAFGGTIREILKDFSDVPYTMFFSILERFRETTGTCSIPLFLRAFRRRLI